MFAAPLRLRPIAGILLIGLSVAGASQAQSLSAAEAEDYLGTWALSMEFQGNPVQLTLEIGDLSGEVKAALSAAFSPEPQLMDTVTKTDEGLTFAYDADFGGNSIRIEIDAAREGEKLVGNFGDTSGLFTAEFSGERAAEAADILAGAVEAAADKAEAPQRSRRFGTYDNKVTLQAGNELRLLHGSLKTGTADHEALLATQPGEVFQFPGSRGFKLYTDADLAFGETVVRANNFAPDYPGVYGVWLKRTQDGEGWELVFNVKADLWGSMHEPATDVATVPLTVGTTSEAAEELLVELVATDDGGSIRFVWDTTTWTASFRVN